VTVSKRIFLLGPSHHYQLSTLALPTYTSYATPLSPHPLPLDTALLTQLSTLSPSTKFSSLAHHNDDAEHSLEMHLPYIHKMLSLTHPTLPPSQYPPLVPILVGSTSPAVERAFGTLLAPYLADPENSFVISSDFCHWGSRFSYTYYVPAIPPSLPDIASPTPLLPATLDPQTRSAITSGRDLGRSDKPKGVQIHQSIAAVDLACMCAITTGSHAAFSELLRETGNTVCGRHPIGVMMAAIEALNKDKDGEESGKFRFIRYERSSDAVSARDSSVSYVSGFAVL
jgi:MEMO1 family protein